MDFKEGDKVVVMSGETQFYKVGATGVVKGLWGVGTSVLVDFTDSYPGSYKATPDNSWFVPVENLSLHTPKSKSKSLPEDEYANMWVVRGTNDPNVYLADITETRKEARAIKKSYEEHNPEDTFKVYKVEVTIKYLEAKV